jgi:hypothetical protein
MKQHTMRAKPHNYPLSPSIANVRICRPFRGSVC